MLDGEVKQLGVGEGQVKDDWVWWRGECNVIGCGGKGDEIWLRVGEGEMSFDWVWENVRSNMIGCQGGGSET